MYIEIFRQKLKKARKDIGFTQVEVCKELNIPQSTLANYETGRTQPDLETLAKLADFYEVSIDWLLGTKGENKA
ncbi:MAG: helix-turn-helix domain-containing protein [Lachnospiraceae bacterium]|nr:helix-turn-helix domain-containing protein [Lachnospiraceae bacterium]